MPLAERQIPAENPIPSKGLQVPQTPSRLRKKLGDSSNVFNNVPLSAKSETRKLSSGIVPLKKLAEVSGKSLHSLPVVDDKAEGKEKILKAEDNLALFLGSSYDVNLGMNEPKVEPIEPSTASSKEISFEEFLDLKTENLCNEINEPNLYDDDNEKEQFGNEDDAFEAWLNSVYDVDLGKGEVFVAPAADMTRKPAVLDEFEAFLDKLLDSDNNALPVLSPNAGDENSAKPWDDLSELEQNLLAYDIDELLNL